MNLFCFLFTFSMNRLNFEDKKFNFVNKIPYKTDIIKENLRNLKKVNLSEGTFYAPILGNFSILGEIDVLFEIHYLFEEKKGSKFSIHVEAFKIEDSEKKYGYKENIFLLSKEFFLDAMSSYLYLKKILELSFNIFKYETYLEDLKKNNELLLIETLCPKYNEEVDTDDDSVEYKIKKLKLKKKSILEKDLYYINDEIINIIHFLLSEELIKELNTKN
jgi:hypothetical protein